MRYIADFLGPSGFGTYEVDWSESVPRFERVSELRSSPSWTAQLFHPVERPLPGDSPVRSIEIGYPGRDSWLYGPDWWVLTFFVVSMAAAMILAPVFKVRF